MTPSIADIQAVVCNRYKLPLIEMRSARRSRIVAYPRQLAMYLCRTLTPQSLPAIGRHFGDRDHSTVIHAVRQVEARMAASEEFRLQVRLITAGAKRRATRRVNGIRRDVEAMEMRA